MRAKDIEVGGIYWTKVGDQRVKVRVVMTRKGGVGIGKMGKFQVERVDNGQLLPKWRSAQALHPTGEGPWPGVMQRQEYPGFEGAEGARELLFLLSRYPRLRTVEGWKYNPRTDAWTNKERMAYEKVSREASESITVALRKGLTREQINDFVQRNL